MKFFKKFFAVLISAVMALALFVFSACDGETEPKPKDSDLPTETTAFLTKLKSQVVNSFEMELTYEGSTDYTYRRDNFPAILEQNNSEQIALARQDHSETISSALSVKGSLSTGDIDFIATSNGTCTREVLDDEGHSILGDHGHDYYKMYSFVRDWNVFSCYQVPEDDGSYNEVESFDGLEVKYLGNVLSAMTEEDDLYNRSIINGRSLASATVADSAFGFDLPVGSLLQALPMNYVIAALANQARALTFTENKAIVNVNKLVYNMVNDFKEVVDGLKNTTTLGEILANETVKGYLSVFTELVTPEDVQTGIALVVFYLGMLQDLGGVYDYGYDADTDYDYEGDEEDTEFGIEQIFAMLQIMLNNVSLDALLEVEPDRGSTTYDYIVKIISSEELGNIVMQILSNMMGAPQSRATDTVTSVFTLDKVTIEAILELVNLKSETPVTLAGMQADYDGFAQTVTENSFSAASSYKTYYGYTEETVTTFSNVIMEYNFDSAYNVISQTLSLDAAVTGTDSGFSHDYSYGDTQNYYYSEYDVTGSVSITATLTYLSEEVNLTDISEAVVNEYGYSFEGAQSAYPVYLSVVDGEDSDYPVQYTADIMLEAAIDDFGDVVGVYICDVDGNKITEEYVEFGDTCRIELINYEDVTKQFEFYVEAYDMEESYVFVRLTNNDNEGTTFIYAEEVIISSYTVDEILTGLSGSLTNL